MDIIKNATPLYQNRTYSDFRELLNTSVDLYGDKDAFIIKHKKSRKEFTYETVSFNQFRQDVNFFGTGMVEEGLLGKRIAIIGKNRYEWVLSYFAAVCGLGMCVPLDKGLPYEELESSLARSYSDVLIFDKEHKADVERVIAEGKTNVKVFICMDEIEGYKTVKDIKVVGRKSLASGNTEYLKQPIDNEAVSILLFTSGTTSMAKAVMLSQRNILSNVEMIQKVVEVVPTDVTMAFLPYHHTFGFIGQLVLLAGGSVTTYCDGLRYLQQNLVEYKVTLFFCVPLLIESIYKKVMAGVQKQGKEKTVAFGMKLTKFLMKFGIDIRRKIFKDVLDQLGGDLRLVVSGAAAIDPVALEGFKSFGIEALQGFGMTEASPVIAVETVAENRLGSIGRPVPGVEAMIIDKNEEGIGELICRGENVMHGYYENEEETVKVLKDGWLHTGDLAREEDGYIFICGRKKNVIVLKNGKNVYPEELEVLIANLPYVKECMVFGEPRHHDGDERDLAICAKIVYDPAYMSSAHNTEDADEIQEIVKKDIDAINETLPSYKQMLRVITTDQEMVKTTTGKVKRFVETKNV